MGRHFMARSFEPANHNIKTTNYHIAICLDIAWTDYRGSVADVRGYDVQYL